MHTRKKFLIYPTDYKPGDGYLVRYSKLQAWRVAIKMGSGASIYVEVQKHPKRCHAWISCSVEAPWEITVKGDK